MSMNFFTIHVQKSGNSYVQMNSCHFYYMCIIIIPHCCIYVVDSRRTKSDHEERGEDEQLHFMRILDDETNETTTEKWKSVVRMPSSAVNGFTDNGSTNTCEKIFMIPDIEGEKYFIYIFYNIILYLYLSSFECVLSIVKTAT